MSQISRIHSAEIQNGLIIDAGDLSDEYNNIISEVNAQDLRVVDITSNASVFSGDKTFADSILVNTISERTATSGVQVDSVRLRDGMIKVAGTPSTNGEIGYVSNQMAFFQNGNLVNFTPYGLQSSRSSDSQLAFASWGASIICTGTFTQTFASAASLTAGWFVDLRNDGTGVITLDPNGSELIDGFSSVNLGPGNSCRIICDGTGLKTLGRSPEYIVLRDEKASGSDGGTFTAGSFVTRTLNTEALDTANNCTLNASQFTLQPGTYLIEASATANSCNDNKTKLVNVTDTVDVLIGTNEFASSSCRSWVIGKFSITTAKAFELQHRCSTTRATDGLGRSCSFSVNEVYASVKLTKII